MKTKTLLALTLGALLIPSCGKKADLPAINVGLIAELTGDLSAFGASCKNAAELKVAEIGDKGGIDIGGKKYTLRLVIEDSQGTADQAVAAAQRLVKEDTVLA
ncbi:MAG TPA: ABC transporter substrate-binding protein, partial [Thermoanaerobaculia bacterium]|nr:ABC transporter substrate-binding protein [Thermoanaerobaculia bacterium]